MNEPDVVVGQQIDNYRISRQIGQGGMAAVYLARDIALDRDVVIKMMLPALAQDEKLRLRFQREARATARLRHENIVTVYTTGMAASQRPYIAMEYIDGGSLTDYLQELDNKGQRIAVDEALVLMRQIAGALVVAHNAGIIHRDLKPSNILLRKDGTAVLSDLGIAAVQQASTRLTRTGGVLGSPHYMSPEQGLGQPVDGRSDIYSFGVILYELLSGQLPFDAGSPVAIVHQHVYQDPPPLEQMRPGLTAEIYQVAIKCLQKDPADRYQNAGELSTALVLTEQAKHYVAMGTTTRVDAQPLDTQAQDEIKVLPIAATSSPIETHVGRVPGLLNALTFIAIIIIVAALTAFWLRNRNVVKDSIDAAATTLPAILESPEVIGTTNLRVLDPTSAIDSSAETREPAAPATREPPDTPSPRPSPTIQAASEPRGCVNGEMRPFVWDDAKFNADCSPTSMELGVGHEVRILSDQSVAPGGECGPGRFIKIQSLVDHTLEGWIFEDAIDLIAPGESCSP